MYSRKKWYFRKEHVTLVGEIHLFQKWIRNGTLPAKRKSLCQEGEKDRKRECYVRHIHTTQHDDKGGCQEKKMEGKETSIRMRGLYCMLYLHDDTQQHSYCGTLVLLQVVYRLIMVFTLVCSKWIL